MKTGIPLDEVRQRLGADRVLEPPGSLPQPAERLDPSGPVRPYEFEVAVERLLIDSTSFRDLGERAGRDAARMAKRIVEIVSGRGKLHNPATDSGGGWSGSGADAGGAWEDPP